MKSKKKTTFALTIQQKPAYRIENLANSLLYYPFQKYEKI